MTQEAPPWIVAVVARLVPAAHRDDVLTDVVEEAERLGRGSLWTAWQVARSARDDRRTALRLRQDDAPGMEETRMRTRLALPTRTDLRLALRAVRRGGASTAAIILTLALAIGGTTAMYSVVHAVLLEPLPYADPDRLVRVWERHVPRNRTRNVVAPANFMEWRDRATTLVDMTAISFRSAALTGDGTPEQVPTAAVTWNLFRLLGVEPAFGRAFVESESRPGDEATVMLGWELWQRRYGGDPALVGRSITANGRQARVVGIAPAGFRLFGAATDLWVVFTPTDAWREPTGRSFEVLARLAPGATLAEANAEMDVIALALERQWPDFNDGWRVSVVGAHEDLVGNLTRPLWLLLIAVAVVLVIGCANAANLLIARAADRRREFEVRSALGATRGHLLAQLALEGLVLSTLGTLAGVLAAGLGLRATVGLAGSALGIPRLELATLDLPVLAGTLGLLAFCTCTFTLAPGWLASRSSGSALGGGTRAWTGGRTERRVRGVLVAAQVAFAVVLVVGAGLVARSLQRLVSVDPGFDAENLLTFTVALPSATYSNEQQIAFFAEAAADLRALPGVDAVGAISWLPFAGPGGGTSFDVDGRVPLASGQRPVADIRPVDDAYFDVMKIPIRRGRTFRPDEVRSGARLAIVNETLARQVFPDEDPIGKRLQVNWNDGLDEIVGVVADVRIAGLATEARPQIYFPQGTANVGFVTYVVRTTVDDERSLLRPAVAAIQSRDANLPVRDARTMRKRIDASLAAPETAAWLVGAFGTLALVLALVGVAGLQAALVAARRNELAIRLALGATPAGIRWLVVGGAGRLITAGLAGGVVGAYLVSRSVTGLLYDAPAFDSVAFLTAAVAVTALGLLSSAAAVRRAARTHPASVLRS